MIKPHHSEVRQFWRIDRDEPDASPRAIELVFGHAAFEAPIWFSGDTWDYEVEANPDGSIFDESEQEIFPTKAEALQACIELMQERMQAYFVTMGRMEAEIRQLKVPQGQSYDI